MLDERGVEYVGTHPAFTAWWGNHDLYWSAMEVYDGELDLGTNMSSVSPEQAIAATLGVGTCQIETTENWLPAERYHRCNHCGAFFAVLDASGDIPPRCCPNCGRKVVDDG